MDNRSTTTAVAWRWDAAEIVLGAGAVAMAAGAFMGHLLAPGKVADHYGTAASTLLVATGRRIAEHGVRVAMSKASVRSAQHNSIWQTAYLT
jgi:hypothetical protein